ncbi:VacJ-like lipoprotein [Nitrosococcus oceani ATCC 19707]|uniref:VacJ-like lipoprotein n=3 Tax=Nitrosococcus oceani TaxID=1229 RepID=Q3JCF9_NITOC|nr:VacJ-like lipoprotein [Nitrosococcus oceani ATCC 19707]KFI19985.1 ABC transporter [Nitrosococcus oceani C-27]KFI23242.1 ABC transporter [Nitrosococcus oceani]GEM20726.1 ABC transporter [Nitrosococcus oceani]
MMRCATMTKLFFTLLLVTILQGCASQPHHETLPIIPPKHSLSEIPTSEELTIIDVYDPLEPANRVIYFFNYQFDKYIFLPAVNAYEFITPDLIERGISNFFSNIRETINFTNTLLQLKFSRALKTAARFIVNSTIGIAGIWDPATHLELYQHREDFGQTLGHYGLGPGPYLVIPVLGPSNLRDAIGLAADSLLLNAILSNIDHYDELRFWLPFYFVEGIDQRHRTNFRYYETGSPFEYDLIRFLYLKVREANIAK